MRAENYQTLTRQAVSDFIQVGCQRLANAHPISRSGTDDAIGNAMRLGITMSPQVLRSEASQSASRAQDRAHFDR
jgi:hypothetical protein